ncbi:hypothetical protein ACJ73_06383 [Blastomyces percursus]|uniref:Uncharacterized protein n=1 Tax=Blastomyces percursus TaxID=1658174 RepID=A0A1J9Q2F9_9EURO|nr:hypothetical protein ACJ73_06383 [Blastomyces percursus]
MDNTISAKSSALQSDTPTHTPPTSPAHNQSTSLNDASGGKADQGLYKENEIWDKERSRRLAVISWGSDESYVEMIH